MRAHTIATCLLAAALTASCSSTPETTSTGGDAGGVSEPAPTFTSAGGAGELTYALAKKTPTVRTFHVFTAASDPNKLLGRPGGYIGKATFTDTRVPKTDRTGENDSIDDGGGIEVFADTAGANARKKTIDAALQGAGGVLGVEYSYVSGRALLRISGKLTPDVAKEYEAAWPAVVEQVL